MGIESPIHLLFIGIVALLVLGPKRLPEVAKRLGDGVREFRQAIDAGAEQHKAPPQAPGEPVVAAPSQAPGEPVVAAPPQAPAEPGAAALSQPADADGTPPHA
jgi:sec-independent protein translocase protein TatA